MARTRPVAIGGGRGTQLTVDYESGHATVTTPGPDGATDVTTYQYDPARNVLTGVLRKGAQVSQSQFDANLVLSPTDGNGNTITIAITNTGTLNRQLSYDAQARLVQVTLGSPVTSTIAPACNAFGQRADYSVTPEGADQPRLDEAFKYQGDRRGQWPTPIPTCTARTGRRWSCCGRRRGWARPRPPGTCWTARATSSR